MSSTHLRQHHTIPHNTIHRKNKALRCFVYFRKRKESNGLQEGGRVGCRDYLGASGEGAERVLESYPKACAQRPRPAAALVRGKNNPCEYHLILCLNHISAKSTAAHRGTSDRRHAEMNRQLRCIDLCLSARISSCPPHTLQRHFSCSASTVVLVPKVFSHPCPSSEFLRARS